MPKQNTNSASTPGGDRLSALVQPLYRPYQHQAGLAISADLQKGSPRNRLTNLSEASTAKQNLALGPPDMARHLPLILSQVPTTERPTPGKVSRRVRYDGPKKALLGS